MVDVKDVGNITYNSVHLASFKLFSSTCESSSMHFHFRKHAEFLKLEFPVVVNVLHVILKLIIRAVVYFNFLSIVMALVREADYIHSCRLIGYKGQHEIAFTFWYHLYALGNATK